MTEPDHITEPADPFALYRQKFAPMTADQRVQAATLATGNSLLALCHDADPRVIKRVLENHTSDLEHARLIAKSHNSTAGLGFIVNNPQLIRDSQVQRNLLKNSVLTESHLRTIMTPKTLKQSWQIAVSTEIAENHKSRARVIIKEKFRVASSEEKAAFIFDTEGRVLILLHDVPLDEKTVAILCQRTYNSIILIQNLAKWSKSPPRLLKRLEIQNIVKHNQSLLRQIKLNPNYPSQGGRA